MSYEDFKLVLMLLTNLGGIAIAVAVLKTQVKHIDVRVLKNEADIVRLFNETRYVMTGNEIRRILHEQVDPLSKKIDSMHDDIIVMKARRDPELRARTSD